MVSETQAAPYFARAGLADVPRVGDPEQRLHRAFALRRTTVRSILSRFVLRRGWEAARAGHLNGRLVGDGLRLGGVFLLRDGRVLRAFRHATVADRPDYAALAQCPVGEGA